MDLDEYSLNEAQRTLKRLGITHLWREAAATALPAPMAVADTAEAAVPPHTAPRPSPPSPGRREEPLPSLLKTLFHGKQPPVATMWTYAGLYSDLQQATVPARLDMFRKIQASARAHLNWAENDICSWPLDVSPSMFHKGLHFFRPRMVIAFGPAARIPGMPEAQGESLGRTGPKVLALPSLEEMAAGNKQLKNDAWQALQGIRP